jgi:hypothetical protein
VFFFEIKNGNLIQRSAVCVPLANALNGVMNLVREVLVITKSGAGSGDACGLRPDERDVILIGLRRLKKSGGKVIGESQDFAGVSVVES